MGDIEEGGKEREKKKCRIINRHFFPVLGSVDMSRVSLLLYVSMGWLMPVEDAVTAYWCLSGH